MGGMLDSLQQGYHDVGGFEGLLENPRFQAGLGILEANNAGYGESSNPFTGALKGVQRAGQLQDARLGRETHEQEQEMQRKLREALAKIYGANAQNAALPGVSAGQLPTGLPGNVGVPPGFTTAPGTSAAPGALEEVAAAFLQYGTPQQQSAVFSQMSANARFKQQTAIEEARYQRKKDPSNNIGQYNPRDYTAESWADFINSKDPGKLKRYERTREVDLGGGRKGLYDPVTHKVTEVVDKQAFDANVKDVSQSKTEGKAEGAAITAAKEGLAGMKVQEAQLERMFADPNFSQSVGPIDAVTGRIGEWFGSDQGVLGGEVQRVVNALVTQAVSNWKGAISEKELDFFLDSVPSRGSSDETWKSWYQNEYMPRRRLMERIATGEVFFDDRLVGGSSSGYLEEGTTNTGVKWRIEQ